MCSPSARILLFFISNAAENLHFPKAQGLWCAPGSRKSRIGWQPPNGRRLSGVFGSFGIRSPNGRRCRPMFPPRRYQQRLGFLLLTARPCRCPSNFRRFPLCLPSDLPAASGKHRRKHRAVWAYFARRHPDPFSLRGRQHRADRGLTAGSSQHDGYDGYDGSSVGV